MVTDVLPPAVTSASGVIAAVGGVNGDSTAPTSAATPTTLANPAPRWSVASAPVLDPRLIVGPFTSGACVRVGPPLSASGPSRASRTGRPPPPTWSPFAPSTNPGAPAPLPIRLFPWLVATNVEGRSMSGDAVVAVLPAMTVLRNAVLAVTPVTVANPPPVPLPAARLLAPPAATLRVSVLLLINPAGAVSPPPRAFPPLPEVPGPVVVPAPPVARFPETVLFVTVADAGSPTPPPAAAPPNPPVSPRPSPPTAEL